MKGTNTRSMEQPAGNAEWQPGDIVYEPFYDVPLRVLAEAAGTPGMIMVVSVRDHEDVPVATWPDVLKPWPVPIAYLGWTGVPQALRDTKREDPLKDPN